MKLVIVDWDRHFENNRSRELKEIQWVAMPNKQHGDGYLALVCGHKNGPAHFGAWVAIVEIASKCVTLPASHRTNPAGGCGTRGLLVRSTGEWHDFKSLSIASHFPVGVIKEAVPRLLAIGWLGDLDDKKFNKTGHSTAPQAGAGSPQAGAGLLPTQVRPLPRARRSGNGNGIESPNGDGAAAPRSLSKPSVKSKKRPSKISPADFATMKAHPGKYVSCHECGRLNYKDDLEAPSDAYEKFNRTGEPIPERERRLCANPKCRTDLSRWISWLYPAKKKARGRK
jgi:hypothetical protein